MKGYRINCLLNSNKVWISKKPNYTKYEAKRFNKICRDEWYSWISPHVINKYIERLKKEGKKIIIEEDKK